MPPSCCFCNSFSRVLLFGITFWCYICNGLSAGLSESHNVLGRRRRVKVPKSLCLGRIHDLTVVLEDLLCAGMAHQKRQLRRILVLCQMITGEAVSKPVIRPFS